MNELNKVSLEIPFVPGTMEEFYNKNKRGEKYGPYYRLSYNLKGKNSSLFVKQKEAEQIKLFSENYKGLREYLMVEGVKNLELLQKKGIECLLEKYQNSQGLSSAKEKNIILSRNKWKEKAIKRQEVIYKNNTKIRDLKKSRDNWKEKYKRLQKKAIELEEKLEPNDIDANKKNLKKND